MACLLPANLRLNQEDAWRIPFFRPNCLFLIVCIVAYRIGVIVFRCIGRLGHWIGIYKVDMRMHLVSEYVMDGLFNASQEELI